MVNKKFWLGMLVMVLAFGMTVIGCDNGTTNNGNENGDNTGGNNTGGGTDITGLWMGDDYGFKFSNGTYQMDKTFSVATEKFDVEESGTYTVTGTTVNMDNGGRTRTGVISGTTMTIDERIIVIKQ